MRTRACFFPGVCAALILAAGCDGGGDGTGGGGSGAGGSGGSSTTTAPAGGAGGGGMGGTTSMGGGGAGGVMDAPFTSKGESSYETTTSLAADGKGGVVAVWVAFFSDNTSGVGYAVSRDDGEHWTAPAVIKSPGDRLASNPVVVADSKGVFSLAWLGFRADGTTTDEHIYVSALDGATESFGAPIVASDDGTSTTLDFDKPSLKVDAEDALLLTWADFTLTWMGGPASTVFARSTDGKTFSTVKVADDATFGNLASLCLDASLGATAPLYMVHLGANGTVTLRTSTNQGQAWQLHSTPASSVVFQDITCAVKDQTLWIAYAAGSALFTPGEDSPGDDVMVIRSTNGGVSFDPPVKASSGPAGDQYLFPQLTRSPSGKIGVVYYQGKVGSPATLMLASSEDGATWTASPITATGTFTVDRTIASWLGAYIGFAIPADTGLVSYAENTENKAHIGFARIALP